MRQFDQLEREIRVASSKYDRSVWLAFKKQESVPYWVESNLREYKKALADAKKVFDDECGEALAKARKR